MEQVSYIIEEEPEIVVIEDRKINSDFVKKIEQSLFTINTIKTVTLQQLDKKCEDMCNCTTNQDLKQYIRGLFYELKLPLEMIDTNIDFIRKQLEQIN